MCNHHFILRISKFQLWNHREDGRDRVGVFLLCTEGALYAGGDTLDVGGDTLDAAGDGHGADIVACGHDGNGRQGCR